MSRIGLVGVLALALAAHACQCGRRQSSKAPRSVQEANRELHSLTSAVGTNLSGIHDWSAELPFVDLFKSSRAWISGNSDGSWDDGRPLDLDEHGWVRSLKPNQVARTLMLTDVEHYPKGKYVVVYDGVGSLEYGGSPTLRFAKNESKPGRHVLDLDPAGGPGGIQLTIASTDPSNPVRNIRVLMPGFEDTHTEQVFNPAFLSRLSGYSVLRFMDWTKTNDSVVARWSDRPRLDDARWSVKGVPFETMLELAERLKVEPWFTVPHRADDEYVRRMAELVKERLHPGAHVWLEYSNEVWNGIFDQHSEVGQCAAEQNEDDPFRRTLLCYSKRAVEVFNIWHSAFGQERARIVRVMSSQSTNPWVSEQILARAGAHELTDALAVAPYFGAVATEENRDEIASMTLDDLVSYTRKKSIPEAIGFVEQQASIASKYDLALVAYEGGQHFVGVGGVENDAKINTLYDAINRDPRIASLYESYLVGWKQAGGQLFVHYTSCDAYSKWGRFGLLEYITQPPSQAPKYEAVQRFIQSHPPWW